MIRRHILKSRKQEKLIAKKFCGRVQPGSGSGWENHGDVKTEKFLCECKRTDGSGIRITKKILDKIEKQAVQCGREALLVMEIGGKNYYVLAERTFDMISDVLEKRL